jgi:hypothetical protein
MAAFDVPFRPSMKAICTIAIWHRSLGSETWLPVSLGSHAKYKKCAEKLILFKPMGSLAASCLIFHRRWGGGREPVSLSLKLERAMNLLYELDFCLKREAEERAASRMSSDPASRDAHLVLAEHYADRVWSLEGERIMGVHATHFAR